MAILKTAHESTAVAEATVSFELTGTEHPETWEGWFTYRLELSLGQRLVAAVDGAIIEADIDELVSICARALPTLETYEPMEPDFSMDVCQHDDNYVDIRIFIDATAAAEGYYSASGAGLRLIVDKLALQRFGRDIKAAQAALKQQHKL